MQNKNTIVVHSTRMVGWLLFNGISHIGIYDDKKKIGKKVYIYNKTDFLSETMSRFTKITDAPNDVHILYIGVDRYPK